jgi:tetratricopeptide (TPR) repeat protein
VLPVFAYGFVYLLATLFSIAPQKSLWGSYERMAGAYTTLAFFVIFASIAVNLRTRSQLKRLITAIVIASFPVCVYGILQRFGLDPMRWADETARITSTMGNPIFLGAYMIMVFPLTLVRAFESFSAVTDTREGRLLAPIRLALYALLALLQLAALFLSGSRGPVLGWIGGSVFFILLLSLLWQRRLITFACIGAFLLIFLSLLVFNLPRGPLQNLRTLPGIGRLGELLNAQSSTGRVRTLIWSGSAELVEQHPPLQAPGTSEDRFNALRPLFGYGPESMYLVFPRFYPPELAQLEELNAMPDRAHNETWDSLITEGFFGALAYLGLYASIFYFGMRWLGLVSGRVDARWFWIAILAGLAAGAALSVLIGGIAWLGLGLPLGMLVGLSAFLLRTAALGKHKLPETGIERSRILILLALISAIIAHFIEINFGIAVSATRLYFWVFVALMLVLGEYLPGPEIIPTAEDLSKKQSRVRWLIPALESGILSGILLGTLGFDFVTHLQGGRSALQVLWLSLAGAQTPADPSSNAVLSVFALTWFFTGFILTLDLSTQRNFSFPRVFSILQLVSALVGVAFIFLRATWVASAVSFQPASPMEALAQTNILESLVRNYWLYLIIVMILLAASLASKLPARLSWSPVLSTFAVSIVLFSTIYIAGQTNLRPVQADIAASQADLFSRTDSWMESVALYQRAVQLAPKQDEYSLKLGGTYLDISADTASGPEKEAWIIQAQDAFSRAWSINPINPDSLARLAQAYRLWANIAPDEKTRDARGQIADGYYSQAAMLSPNNASLWNDWAILYLDTLQAPETARPLLEKALALDPNYANTHALLGRYYTSIVDNTVDNSTRSAALRQAVEEYQLAMELAGPKDIEAQYLYSLLLAGAYVNAGLTDQAIETYESAIQLGQDPAGRWRIEEILARLYFQAGEKDNALLHATKALAAAPEDQVDRIYAMISEFQGAP